MPTFDAGTSVEALDYDFSAVPNWPKKLPATGTVHEPSDAAIGYFLEGIKDLYKKAENAGLDALGSKENPSAEELVAAMDAVTGDAFVEMMADMSRLFAELCSGHPSFEQIQALPMRVRLKFFGWIQGQVVRPEDETSAGTAQVLRLPTAATG